MNSQDIGLSQWVNDLFAKCFEENDSWLRDTFRRCLVIKNARKDVPDYGFEWALETLVGDFLLRHQGEYNISKLGINQTIQVEGKDKSRPDFSFFKENVWVIVKLKQTTKGSLQWTKNDVVKTYHSPSEVFFLTISYPFEGEPPKRLEGATFISDGILAQNFRYSLFMRNRPTGA